MVMYAKTKNIMHSGNGVSWTFVDWDGTERHYRTNAQGEGVFEIVGTQSRQILGTAQFSLQGVSDSTVRRRILKFHEI